MDITNGLGVGCSLFVQGCPFHCRGCFNPGTWDFDGGKEWTNAVEDKFIELVNRPYIKRVSILGGEPLADQNINCVSHIIQRIKDELPNKTIWIYSGFKFENMDLDRLDVVSKCSYLVDGQFEIDKQDLNLPFRGSLNQRIIDIQNTLNSNKIQFYKEV